MKEYKGSPALAAGLLAAAQAVEHYEISRYGTLKTWANELGLSDAARLLEQTLDEEKKTDASRRSRKTWSIRKRKPREGANLTAKGQALPGLCRSTASSAVRAGL